MLIFGSSVILSITVFVATGGIAAAAAIGLMAILLLVHATGFLNDYNDYDRYVG